MTVPFTHNITVANLIVWLIDKLFHCFSLTNNAAALSELNCKGLNLKGGNKRQFKDLKICKVAKGKHERSMFLPVGWIKLHSSELN